MLGPIWDGHGTVSLPPRGAWIEIVNNKAGNVVLSVAPPTGSVD